MFHFVTLNQKSRKQLITVFTLLIIFLIMFRSYLLLPPEDKILSNGARLEWKSCSFDIPLTEIIHCAILYPSLQNKQRNVTIPIVVVKNIGFERQSDPVLYINGGPGTATGFKGDDITYWLDNINGLNWNRDFVLYDQRGTGESTPKIICPSFKDFLYDVLTTDLSQKLEMLSIYNHHKECKFRIQEFDGDLTGYSTKYNTQDVLDITHALNYSKWNIFGVSYGTRVALEIMRTKPTNIRSVILDSVYPSDKHDLLTWPSTLDNAIKMIFERCSKDKLCQSTYPNLRDLFKTALRKLKYTSMYVYLSDYYSDGALGVYINDSRFLDALFFAMYDPELISMIPAAINDVAHGKQKALIPIVTAFADVIFDDYSNIVTFNSVLCNDEVTITHKQYKAVVDPYPSLKPYTSGIWQYDTCHVWKTNDKTILKTERVKSRIPTLVLAGEDNSVTPWQWGKEVHQGLINSFYYVYPNTTHGVIGSNECATQMGTQFLTQLKITKSENCI